MKIPRSFRYFSFFPRFFLRVARPFSKDRVEGLYELKKHGKITTPIPLAGSVCSESISASKPFAFETLNIDRVRAK